MVHLTLLHDRDLFNGNEFHKWVYRLFPNAKFDGYMRGRWFPTLIIPFHEFRDNYKNIPLSTQSKIAGIETKNLSILSYLSSSTFPIHRITNLHPDFKKVTGRDNYGEKVQEILDVPRNKIEGKNN